MDRSLVCLLITVALFPCGVAATANAGGTTVRFPLAVGNQWQYHLNGWSLADPAAQPGVPFSATVTWRVEGRDDVRGESAFRVATEETFTAGPDSGATIAMHTWFVERDDTLMAVASRTGAGSVQPVWVQLFKPVAGLPQGADDWHFASLVYPLLESRSWHAGNRVAAAGTSIRDTKSVGPLERVSAPAGSFDAWPVTYSLQATGFDVAVVQWFAAIGLVRLEVVERHAMQVTDESGQPLECATYEAHARMELVSYQLDADPTAVRPVSWGEAKRLVR